MLIIYSKSCLACTHKKLWNKVKAFAQEHNLPIQEKRISLKKEWGEEADRYGVELPFAVNGKIALNLNEDLDKLL